jgi:hypothetical protein
MTIADGSQIEGFVSKLKSVRLGQFTVGDVECVVLPDSVKGAENLLGGSFLRHFVYRMDLGAGELHMAQMSGKIASPDEPFDGAHRPKTITQAPPSTATSPATRPLAGGMKLPTGSFKILGPKGVQCLAIHDDSRNAGDGLVMAQPGKSAGQLWTAPAASDGFVKLQNKNSGLILAIRQAKMDAGADIIQWNDTGGEEQQWTIESAGGSFVKIICKHSGMCLTRGNAHAKEPEAMTQQPSSDSREQLWLIVPK